MQTEIIYLGHNNSINLVLKENNTAIDLSGITEMTLSFGTAAISSTNSTAQMIQWNKSGYQTGEVRISIGASTKVTAGGYKAYLTVYDATYTDGVVWGEIPILVKADVEGTT